MTDSQQLLADYVANGSETAFRELVSRYLDLVYSTAVRSVGGDTHLAEDVAQTVFANLARKASTLPRDVTLGGWLHRDTCFAASKIMRGERRRQFRERQSVEMNAEPDHSEANLSQVAPVLDEAINHLGSADRTAIVLRFFERRDFRQVGAVLGSNEAAARKRVTRALEKLETLLKHRGITFSAAAMGTVLASQAVSAAPAGLAASISGTALATAAAGGGTLLALIKAMTLTKLNVSIAGTLAVAGATALLVMQHQTEVQLRAELNALQPRIAELSRAQSEHERLLQLASDNGEPLTGSQFTELLKLRGEIRGLRDQTNALQNLRLANARLQARRASGEATAEPDFTAGDLVPAGSLTFAGYATPEAAIQSQFWAMHEGNLDTLIEGVIPDLRPRMLEASAEDKAKRIEAMRLTTADCSVQILNSHMISADEAEVSVLVKNPRGGLATDTRSYTRRGDRWLNQVNSRKPEQTAPRKDSAP